MTEEILEKIKKVCKEVADELALELVLVRYRSSSENGPVLEVFVDKDYNISMEEIDAFTEKVNPLLDDILQDDDSAFVLDISSGGSEREIPFEDLPKLEGHYLDLILKNGEKITAKNVKADENELSLLYFIKGRKKERVLKKEDIQSIRMGYKA